MMKKPTPLNIGDEPVVDEDGWVDGQPPPLPPKFHEARSKSSGTTDARRKAAQLALKELNVYRPFRKARATDANRMRELKEALKVSYEQMAGNFQDWSYFTDRQIAFLKMYAKLGRSSKTKAMRLAGYLSSREESLIDCANATLKRPKAEELLMAFELEEKAKIMLTIDDVVGWFSRIATKAMDMGDLTNANRAMENLGKYLGMFVDKKEVTHTVIHTREELDERIATLTKVLKDAEPEIAERLRVN